MYCNIFIMLLSRGATVLSVTLLSCVFIGVFLDTGVNGADEVDSFDPESLYKYFKDQAKSMDTAYIAEADGLTYFTPITKQLMNNGTVSKSDVLDYYHSLSVGDKREMYNAQKKIKSCWDDVKNDANTPSTSQEDCFYYRWGSTLFCPQQYKDNHRDLAEGDTQLRLVSCLSQKTEGSVFNSPGRRKPFLSNHGIHVESGFGAAFLLYASGSTGVGFSLSDPSNSKATVTKCFGYKFDVSLEFFFSVSYMFDMDDLPGQSSTVEFGMDIPGLEIGIDVLLHYSGSKLIGFGFSVGVGVGIIPIDYATSWCNTKINAEYKDSALVRIGWVRGWKCNPNFLGVISEGKYICCPENNPSKECNTGYCWFIGTRCPHTPQELYPSKGLNFIISRTSCPGQTYIAEAHNNKKKCLNLWRQDGRQKYMYYKSDYGECWFSDTRSVGLCVWAPSPKKRSIHHR